MQYKCIRKIIGGLFTGYEVGDVISTDRFNNLPVEKKACFEVNYEDESFADQLLRNLEKDQEDSED